MMEHTSYRFARCNLIIVCFFEVPEEMSVGRERINRKSGVDAFPFLTRPRLLIALDRPTFLAGLLLLVASRANWRRPIPQLVDFATRDSLKFREFLGHIIHRKLTPLE
jgi:hypothetical protein